MESNLIKAFKKNNLEEIIAIMTSKTENFPLKDKVNLMIQNLCSLTPRTIEHLLPMFNIKNDFGYPTSIYTKSVECSPEVFGFINSYYSPSLVQRKRAYVKALFMNKTENIKKIKGIDPKTLGDLKVYVENLNTVTGDMKRRLRIDLKNSTSKKDTSPEDFLKKRIVYKLDKKLRKSAFKKRN